jgi:predicted house-cleaning noncanonical NTP pyrophosphatase (MazG superfamily)
MSRLPKPLKDKILEIIKSEKRVDYKFSDEEYFSPET